MKNVVRLNFINDTWKEFELTPSHLCVPLQSLITLFYDGDEQVSNVRVSIDPNNIPVVEKKHFSLIVYADGVKRIIRNDTGKTVAFFADGKWEHPVSDYYSFGSEAVSELLDMLKNGDFDD